MGPITSISQALNDHEATVG